MQKYFAHVPFAKEIKRLLNTDVPYAPATGLLEPKPEPVDQAPGAYSFMYIG